MNKIGGSKKAEDAAKKLKDATIVLIEMARFIDDLNTEESKILSNDIKTTCVKIGILLQGSDYKSRGIVYDIFEDA